MIVLDDEPALISTYRDIFSPQVRKAVTSSRHHNLAIQVQEFPSLEVTYCQSGAEALLAIEQGLRDKNPFIGGFFDVKLGAGIDGIETVRQAKCLDPKILCVITTAYQDRSVDEIHKVLGPEFSDQWDFLTKPFSQAEILQKSRNLVSNWNRRRREEAYLLQNKKQQEQLIRSERLAAVGTLARGIGHEFGNVILLIMGKAELALIHKKPEEMALALEIVSQAAERAGVITRNLQSMVKIDAKRELCSPIVPLKEALTLMGHELKKGRITVQENFPTKVQDTTLNKTEIGQIYLNLILNAVHAMEPNGGKLTLSATDYGDKIDLTVSDTGCGIPKENLERIFEPLFTTKQGRGSGIGLSVSRKIAENHGGILSVKSQVGQGTTFTLTLPVKR